MVMDIPDWQTAIDTAEKMVCDELKIKSPETFDQACRILGNAMVLLLISKNQKYGKDNIMNSSEFGIDPKQATGVRANDKWERFKRGLQGVNLGKESMLESAGDMIGYMAIEIFLEKNWYLLPLEDDVATKNKK